MENVMEMARGPLTGEFFAKISRWIHESPDGVKRGFESALPLSIAGLAERASTPEGAQSLLSTLKSGDYPHLDASDLGRAVADPAKTDDVARSGEGFLSRLFGSKERGAVDGLASSAGVSASSASKLLGLAAPLVLGLVGKQAVASNLDANGLRGFLSGQRNQIAGALPGPLARLFGGGVPAQVVSAVPSASRHAVGYQHEVYAAKPRPRWMLPALAALALLGLLMWRHGIHRQAARFAAPVTQYAGDTSRPQVLFAGDGVPAFTKALTGSAALPERFVLRDLTFRTDSAEIDPGGAQVLHDVALALSSHPNARVRVEGHTDNTGVREANLALSQQRADSARAYLISQGVSGDRIQAIGYGPDRPLASNDSPGARAENRRTEVVLLQR